MIDRVPEYPGRITLTPVDGEGNTYDMERADSPLIVGTPLNKNTFCDNDVAERLGLDDETGTPNNCLSLLTQILTASVPASQWSSSTNSDGWYTCQVNVPDMKEVYHPMLDLAITSADDAEEEQAAYACIVECDTYDGYVIFKAIDVPERDMNVRFLGA